MVAKSLVVETRSASPGGVGLRWANDGSQEYTVEECEREEPGTRVILHLDETRLYMADEGRIQAAVKLYADFLPVRIFVADVQANSMNAPWHVVHPSPKQKAEAYRQFVGNRFSDMAIEIIPIELEKPLMVRGVLIYPTRSFPSSREWLTFTRRACS